MGEQLNWKLLLGLGGALVVLGGLTFWYEGYRAPAVEKREEATKKPFALEDLQIESVRIVSGKSEFKFRCMDLDKSFCKMRDSANWEILHPLKGTADRSTVSALLTALNGISPSETLDLSQDPPEKRAQLLKDYQLDPESRRLALIEVVVQDEDKKSRSFIGYLGNKHAIHSSIYMGVERDGKFVEEKVFIVPPQIKSYLSYDMNHWRDKKIFSFSPGEVLALDYRADEGKIFLEKDTGQWNIARVGDKTVNYPGDLENIEGLISAALFLNAKKFPAENKRTDGKAVLAGAREFLEMSFHRAGQKKLTSLTLLEKKSGKETHYYAVNSDMDPVYEIAGDVKNRLVKKLKDLRLQKLVTSQERFQAKKIEFRAPGVNLSLVKAGSDWKLESDDKKTVNSSTVMAVFDQLTGNRVKEFLGSKTSPPGEDKGMHVVLTDNADGKHEIVFWKSKDKLFARDLKSERKEVLELDPSVGKALPWTMDHFEKASAPPAQTPPTPHGHDEEEDGHDH